MKICLIRHGPALPRGTEGVADDERPLTPEGRARTRAAARGLRKLKLGIDVLWSSPLPRARETAEIVAGELKLPAPRLTDALRPGATLPGLARLLGEGKAGCPAFVGHEPDLGEIVAALTGAKAGAFPMKKAGAALLELTKGGARPRAELRLFLAPSVLRSL